MKKRGREIFDELEIIFKIIIKVISIFPKSLSYWLYDYCYSRRGKVYVALRYCILKRLGKDIGKNVYIGSNVVIKYFEKLELGDNVSIHEFCYIDAEGGVRIGSNVSIAHNSTILSSNHNYNNLHIPIKEQGMIMKETIVEDNVWLGASVKIMPGITIRFGSVVAAGAVVTKNTERNSVYAGVPAKMIKMR